MCGWTRTIAAVGSADTMTALGYYVPASQDRIDIQFLRRLEGYIWVFPRAGHLSVGICGKGQTAQALRTHLERYMDDHGIVWKGAKFYSHMLPSLESHGWNVSETARRVGLARSHLNDLIRAHNLVRTAKK